ncbi:MAG: tetratricopeptide repeat protein [Deltaproteobacteria bacterium]|jgi:Tfp pilus assembly protein PilF|nr:tetratricopeptide repeat protein [Deltaproteobacteria bacterium]
MRILLRLWLLALVVTLLAACAPSRPQPNYDPVRRLNAVIDVGLVAIQTGDYSKALVTLREAEKMAPNNADIKHYIGRVYYLLDDTETAINFYNQALAMDPTKTEIHNNLGIIYMEAKEYDKARAEFQLCIDDLTYGNPNKARYNMGLLEENQGQPDKAIPYYERIIYFNDADNSDAAYYRLAYIAYNKGNFALTVDYLTMAVRLDPEYADAFFLLGETYEKLNRREEAAESYGRAVEIDSSSLRGIEAQRRIREIMSDYQR